MHIYICIYIYCISLLFVGPIDSESCSVIYIYICCDVFAFGCVCRIYRKAYTTASLYSHMILLSS